MVPLPHSLRYGFSVGGKCHPFIGNLSLDLPRFVTLALNVSLPPHSKHRHPPASQVVKRSIGFPKLPRKFPTSPVLSAPVYGSLEMGERQNPLQGSLCDFETLGPTAMLFLTLLVTGHIFVSRQLAGPLPPMACYDP